jgi:hypothetical protein
MGGPSHSNALRPNARRDRLKVVRSDRGAREAARSRVRSEFSRTSSRDERACASSLARDVPLPSPAVIAGDAALFESMSFISGPFSMDRVSSER